MRTFSLKNKQKSKYVKKWFLVSKKLSQFLNKATYNSFLHNKGIRNLYTWVVQELQRNITLITLAFETVNLNICRFQ